MLCGDTGPMDTDRQSFVEYLIDKGANMHLLDSMNKTPFERMLEDETENNALMLEYGDSDYISFEATGQKKHADVLVARRAWRHIRRVAPTVGAFAITLLNMYADVSSRPPNGKAYLHACKRFKSMQ